MKSDVEENTCKIDEVLPYINENISKTCDEKLPKGEALSLSICAHVEGVS